MSNRLFTGYVALICFLMIAPIGIVILTSLNSAAFLSFPVVASQIYMFVAPGLYKKERAAFLPYLIATPFCFLLGASFVYFVAMPLAMQFFLSMQQAGGARQAAILAHCLNWISEQQRANRVPLEGV